MPKQETNEYGYFYDFRHITVDEIAAYPNGIADIQQRKLDGLIIKNVLSPAEVKALVANIKNQKEEEHTKTKNGYTFPRAFGMADRSASVPNAFENNFREWEQWRTKFPEIFGADVEKRLTDVFSAMAGGKKVEVLPGPNNIGCYTPLTIRVFHPYLNGIPVHCGNMFEELNPTLYADLIKKVYTINQMSYFIQLQTPQRGGELTIYDLEWIKGQVSVGETEIKLADGRVIDTNKEGAIDKFTLKLTPGDMLVFAAGEIWHRVERPLGKSDRISLGGFLGFTKDGNSLTLWS